MINVGVIGLGMMGNTHLDIYAKRDDVNVVAVADRDAQRRSGQSQARGNIEGQAQGGFSLAEVEKKYEDAADLIADDAVELVDICLPTPLHLRFARQALEAGKHVLIEKPLARTGAEADTIAELAAEAKGVAMVAMCMRFWPGWDWLKQAVQTQAYGKVLAVHFRRLAAHPGGPWYSDGKASGGALLDLHVHDSDFVQYCFGMPAAVFAQGYAKPTDEPDHIVTHYLYDGGPLVTAEGGWAMTDGFPFTMQYTVNFERASAKFDLAGGETPLTLYQPGQAPEVVPVKAGMGYEHEIDYLLGCIADGRKPETVTVADAARTVRLIEAEHKSITTGQIVRL